MADCALPVKIALANRTAVGLRVRLDVAPGSVTPASGTTRTWATHASSTGTHSRLPTKGADACRPERLRRLLAGAAARTRLDGAPDGGGALGVRVRPDGEADAVVGNHAVS
jgi:hypothetical protein